MHTMRLWSHRVLAVALSAVALAPVAVRAALPELIKREVFLGDPVKSQPRIAPIFYGRAKPFAPVEGTSAEVR